MSKLFLLLAGICKVFINITNWNRITFCWGMNHINFRTHCVMTQITQPLLTPAICVITKFLANSSLKFILDVFSNKKSRLHLWRTVKFIFVIFFLFFWKLQQKIEPTRRSILIWIVYQKSLILNCVVHTEAKHITNIQAALHFLFNNCCNASNVLNWREFLHYFWLQKLVQGQTWKNLWKRKNILYTPSYALFSSEGSLQVKDLKHHSFISICPLSRGRLRKCVLL